MRYNQGFRRKAMVAVLVAVVLFGLWVRWDFCFESRHRLEELYHGTARALDETGETWWLDYGTLLGAVRDQEMIPHEYDVDLGMPFDVCEKVYAKKDLFGKYGLQLYNRKDFIRSKNTLKYDTQFKRFYWSDGYIHVPCMRVYSLSSGYFVDIYGYIEYSPQQVQERLAKKEAVLLPRKKRDDLLYDPQSPQAEPLLCNGHGNDDQEYESGGCQIKSTIFPLKQMTFLGHKVNIPGRTIDHLVETYGETWRVPTTKGIRGPLCYFHF